MTINEGLGHLKLLKQRHSELTNLRSTNKTRGLYTNSERIDEPVYNVADVDRLAMNVAKEIRQLDTAIKKANAVTELDFEADESVFESITLRD